MSSPVEPLIREGKDSNWGKMKSTVCFVVTEKVGNMKYKIRQKNHNYEEVGGGLFTGYGVEEEVLN